MLPFAAHYAQPHRDCLIDPATRRIALLTGQSNPRCTGLSADQRRLLEAAAPSGASVLPCGFPWRGGADGTRHEAMPLSIASLHNARQYLAAAWSRTFCEFVAARIGRLFAETRETLVLVTGSCGLQLLNGAWPWLLDRPPALGIIALGPVASAPLRIPAPHIVTVQGNADVWSRRLYAGPVSHAVACGHLDYWRDPDVARLVRSAAMRFLA